ncbi:MAG: carbohydrate kinase [Roseibium sp.]
MHLICGEALFDLFGEDSSDTSIAFDGRIGGSPFNVAMGLARLEEDVAFFGGISNDQFGQKLVQKLTSEGVSDHCIVRTDHLTTLSIVQKDTAGSPAYTFYGENAADRMVSENDLPNLSAAPAFIHIGSYTALVEPIASALKTLITQEKEHTLISFDPNIRPTVEPDMDLWRHNTKALVPHCDVIKVSDEDLQLICPEEPIEEVAKRWLHNGASLVIVTKGSEGASAFTSRFQVHCPGVNVKVEDTVGAGDTFQAALLAGLHWLKISNQTALKALDESVLIRLLRLAIKAAAITCSRRGADLPRRVDLANEWSALK